MASFFETYPPLGSGSFVDTAPEHARTDGVPASFHHHHHLLLPRVAEQAGILSGGNPSKYDSSNPIIIFIIQAGIILIFCRLLEWPLSKIRQPRVIAEVVGGILLGPSVMGRIPGFTKAIFPHESLVGLSVAGNLGLILYLFLIGLEVDLRFLASKWKPTAMVAAGSLILPFGLGAALSYGINKEFSHEPGLHPVSFPVFMLFVGLAIAITAFPVLCRILGQLELLSTSVGAITLAAGVANDVVGWILLALCVTLVNAGTGITALWVLLVAAGWTLLMFLIVKPLFIRFLHYTGSFDNGPSQGVIILTILMMLSSAFFTAIIGVHPIFGAFLMGLICPHESGFAIKLTEKIEDLVATLFLPLYFTLSGLNTNLGSLDTGIVWAYVIATICVAFFSKFIGASLSARAAGMVWRESFTVGSLMSCKGLVELIVLNIGYNAKILSQRTFTMFVVMALVTTFATTPLVMWLYPPWYQQKMESWRRGEIDWDGNQLQKGTSGGGSDNTIEPSRFTKLLVFLRADSLIPILTLTSLLSATETPQSETHPFASTKAERPRSPTNPASKQPIHIHAVSFHGLSDRDSSVMRISEAAEFEQHDPLLNSFKIGALLSPNIGVSGEVSTATAYDEPLISRATDLDSDLIIVPWARFGSLSDTKLFKYGPEADATKSSLRSRLCNAEYRDFVSSLFLRAPCTVAVMIPQGRPIGSAEQASAASRPNMYPRSKSFMSARSFRDGTCPKQYALANPRNLHIIVPFIGGRDDRAALRLGLQLAINNPGATMSAIYYRPRTSFGSNSHSDSQKGHLTIPDGDKHDRTSADDATTVISPADEADECYFSGLRSAHYTGKNSRIIFTEFPLLSAESSRRQIINRIKEDFDAISGSRGRLVLVGRSISSFRTQGLSRENPPSPIQIEGNGSAEASSSGSSSTFDQVVPPCLGLVAADLLGSGYQADMIVIQARRPGAEPVNVTELGPSEVWKERDEGA